MLKFKKYQKGKLNNGFNTELLNIYQYRSKSLILKTQTFGKCSINQIKSLKQILNKKTKKIKSQVFFEYTHYNSYNKKTTRGSNGERER